MAGLLVFGKSGQVARELSALAPDARFLSRAEADLSDPEACAAAIRDHAPDAVINAAAWTAVDAAEAEEDAALSINARAPGAMARAAAALGAPFVHISTDYVFDGGGDRPWREEDTPRPLGAYGRTKLDGERAVAEAGGPHAILRTSWVFSPHGQNFVKTMLRLSETRDALSVVSDQTGGPTPARAIAAACLTMADALKTAPAKSGTYHFSGAPDTNWSGFARAIFAEAGRSVTVTDIPTEAYPTPAPRPRNSRLDCSAIHTVFGIDRPDWRAALRETVQNLETAP